MSDMSDSNSTSSTTSNKRRISQIDDNIEKINQEINSLNNFVYRTELECSLMTVRLKREKLKALAAIAKSQVLLANMQVLVAEGELFTDIERLKNIKKMRLNSEAVALQRHYHQALIPQSTSTVSVQTNKGTSEKKKNGTHRSNKTDAENTSSRKSPVDIFSDETVLVPNIYENTTSFLESSQTSLTSLSQLFDKTPASRSGSDISLSSSIKADFNDPFTQSQTKGVVQKSPAKKQKSDKKLTKSKTKCQSYGQKVTSVSGTNQIEPPKTVAELRKTVDTASQNTESISCTVFSPKSRPVENKSSATATYVPARQNNLQFVPQPSTSDVESRDFM